MPHRLSPIRVKNTENGVNNNGCEVTRKFNIPLCTRVCTAFHVLPMLRGKVKIAIRHTTRSGEHQCVYAIQTDREEKRKL